MGMTIHTRRSGDTTHAWPMIMSSAALTTDRWFAKSGLVALGAGFAVSRAVSVLPIRGPRVLMATQLAAAFAATFGTIQVAANHATFRADDLVVDALMAAGRRGPLGGYIASVVDVNPTFDSGPRLLPPPTRIDRLVRMRERLAKKWGVDIVDIDCVPG